MKKLLSLMMVCLCAFGAMAGEVVFDPTVDKGQWGNDDDAAAESLTKDGVTISCTQGRWNLTDQYRVFKNATFTVSSNQPITKIEIACTANNDANYGPGCFTGDDNYTYEGKIGTWTGSSNQISLLASGGQVRMTKVTITIDGEVTPTIGAPTFSPAGGTYYVAQNVEIKAASGATIYYTIDGSDPTTASAVYSEPINVASTTTIKAIATKDDLVSSVASATYTIESMQGVDNIAAFTALEDGETSMFNNPVTVTYANGRNVYVKDATGYMCIYGTAQEISGKYNNGDVIPAGFGGKKAIYNTGIEMTSPLTGFQTATTTAEAAPEEITIDNFSSQPMWKYVILKNALIKNVAGQNNKDVTLGIEGSDATIPAFNQYNVTIPADHSIAYDVIGLITSYNGNKQMYLVEIVDNTPLSNYVDNIAGLMALDEGVNAIISNPVTAVYQNGNNLYIQDESGYALVFGQVNNTYNNGDVITGIAGSWKAYYEIIEMVPLADYFTAGTPGTAVEPEVLAIEELSTNLVHKFIKIDNCTMTKVNDLNYNLNDETGDLTMYMKFNGVTAPEDLTATYNVSGFLTLYKPKDAETAIMEFYPVEFEKVGGEPQPVPGDVNGDGEVTGSDVTALYNHILFGQDTEIFNGDQNGDGEVTGSDVTAVYNIILGL